MYGVSGRQEPRHGIAELAELGGVTRRTVRYYVQEGLLPAPLGVGRGRHYGADHLERLLQVRHLQEQGRTLEEIRSAIDPRGQSVRKARIQGLTPNRDGMASPDRCARHRAAHCCWSGDASGEPVTRARARVSSHIHDCC